MVIIPWFTWLGFSLHHQNSEYPTKIHKTYHVLWYMMMISSPHNGCSCNTLSPKFLLVTSWRYGVTSLIKPTSLYIYIYIYNMLWRCELTLPNRDDHGGWFAFSTSHQIPISLPVGAISASVPLSTHGCWCILQYILMSHKNHSNILSSILPIMIPHHDSKMFSPWVHYDQWRIRFKGRTAKAPAFASDRFEGLDMWDWWVQWVNMWERLGISFGWNSWEHLNLGTLDVIWM